MFDENKVRAGLAIAAVDKLIAFGIKTPPKAAEVHTRYQWVEGNPPKTGDAAGKVRAAFVAGKQPADKDVLASVSAQLVQNAWEGAFQDVRNEFRAAFVAEHSTIVRALREKVTNPIFKRLKELAERGGPVNVEALVRQGKLDDARDLSELEMELINLDKAHEIRMASSNEKFNGPRVWLTNVPDTITSAPKSVSDWVDAIKQGATPHFASATDVREQRAEHQQRQDQAAAEWIEHNPGRVENGRAHIPAAAIPGTAIAGLRR